MAKKNLKVEIFKDSGGSWRWRVRARNGRLVCTSGESFASKFNAKRAWKSFRRGVVAIKEATGSLDQASEIAMRCDLTIISGDDSLTLPLASVGGQGVISVVANVVPSDVKAMTDLILEGDLVSARQWHRKLFALAKNFLRNTSRIHIHTRFTLNLSSIKFLNSIGF